MIIPTVAVVMTSFNRRELTLRSLANLYAQDGQGERWCLKVFLLDDASPDGTGKAVLELFADVKLLHGDGHLYWGGGMNRAMTVALEADPDFVVLLNDDVILDQDAIMRVLADYDEIVASSEDPIQVIVGPLVDPATGTISYSGFRRTHSCDPSKVSRLIPSSESMVPCDTFNGNFVLIPSLVTKRLGPIDAKFIHQLGDLDYGYRVRAMGGQLWMSRRSVGGCACNPRVPPWRAPGLGPIGRWRALNTAMGLPLSSWTTFMWRWGGACGVLRLAGIYALRIAGLK